MYCAAGIIFDGMQGVLWLVSIGDITRGIEKVSLFSDMFIVLDCEWEEIRVGESLLNCDPFAWIQSQTSLHEI